MKAAGDGPSGCVIVTGAARGGTSLVASLCHHIGVPMGKGGPRYENPYLQWAVLADRWDVVAELVAIIARHERSWGWKLPALSSQLDKVASIAPDPRFILVFKNPYVVARRRAQEHPDPKRAAQLLARILQHYARMAHFARTTEHPCLLLAYEDMVGDVPRAAAEIAAFLGRPADLRGIERAVAEDHINYATGNFTRSTMTELDWRLRVAAERAGVFQPGTDLATAVPVELPAGMTP